MPFVISQTHTQRGILSRSVMVGSAESEHTRLISHDIIFEDHETSTSERTAPSKKTDRLSSVSLLMSVESNSRAADARATVTWPSAEVAARLNPLVPNCSFMYQSFDSRIFESSDCFMAQSSPGWAILSVVTQGRRVDATLLQINLQSVLVPQYWPILQTLSRCQLSKKYLLWNPTVWHAHNVSDPSKLRKQPTYRQTGRLLLPRSYEAKK